MMYVNLFSLVKMLMHVLFKFYKASLMMCINKLFSTIYDKNNMIS